MPLAGGCTFQTVSVAELRLHQQSVDLNGLRRVEAFPELQVSCAPPVFWERRGETPNILYTHEQWRSPRKNAGMGVAYIHTLIPLSPQMLVWFAKTQYAQSKENHEGGGKLLGEWTDSMGRVWFEAENARYHVKGYAMTRGTDAWIVYSGYQVKNKPPESDIELAERAADSVAPLPYVWKNPTIVNPVGHKT
ncbi:MAG TPA: hypothetical protein VMD30_01190 [Tepidisphaeraceae bacterium]|nr:hypothetical protein [Tepidisphaeraceae bacterium]